jgi:hypothetical protein
MPGLLVSVRSVAEARAALEGGADLIDVKEPYRGSLGRAGEGEVAAVLRCVAGRRPVSAALGELLDSPAPVSVPGLRYAKWGLAGCAGQPHWQDRLAAAARQLAVAVPGCCPVAVAYADSARAGAPPPEHVWTFARDYPGTALLLDTFCKDGTTLLDLMPAEQVRRFCAKCRARAIRIAVAGSLDAAEIRALLPARPDWFAVRSSACRDNVRGGDIDPIKVRTLAELLTSPAG